MLIAVILSTSLGASAAAPQAAPLDAPSLKHVMISAWGDWIHVEDQCFHNIHDVAWENRASLVLPEGSIIKYIALYYHHDTGFGEAKVDLYSRLQSPPAAVVNTKLATAQSTDDLLFGVVTTGELTIPIDMTSAAYDLVVTTQYASGFCAIRVDYIPPLVFAVASPSVLKNNP